MKDQIDSSTPKTSLRCNRIVVSRYALDRLSPAEHAQFSYAGKFLLKGFDDFTVNCRFIQSKRGKGRK